MRLWKVIFKHCEWPYQWEERWPGLWPYYTRRNSWKRALLELNEYAHSCIFILGYFANNIVLGNRRLRINNSIIISENSEQLFFVLFLILIFCFFLQFFTDEETPSGGQLLSNRRGIISHPSFSQVFWDANCDSKLWIWEFKNAITVFENHWKSRILQHFYTLNFHAKNQT